MATLQEAPPREATPRTDLTVGIGQIVLAQGARELKSVLGSCIGVALHHPRTKTGILAHVMLPCSEGRSGSAGKFADTAVPEMLAQLTKNLSRDASVVARIAGGANMFNATGGPLQIGEQNIAAIKQALAQASIRLVGEHLGGSQGRRVVFDCTTGAMTIHLVGQEPVAI